MRTPTLPWLAAGALALSACGAQIDWANLAQTQAPTSFRIRDEGEVWIAVRGGSGRFLRGYRGDWEAVDLCEDANDAAVAFAGARLWALCGGALLLEYDEQRRGEYRRGPDGPTPYTLVPVGGGIGIASGAKLFVRDGDGWGAPVELPDRVTDLAGHGPREIYAFAGGRLRWWNGAAWQDVEGGEELSGQASFVPWPDGTLWFGSLRLRDGKAEDVGAAILEKNPDRAQWFRPFAGLAEGLVLFVAAQGGNPGFLWLGDEDGDLTYLGSLPAGLSSGGLYDPGVGGGLAFVGGPNDLFATSGDTLVEGLVR